MVKHGVYKSDPKNSINRAEYFNRVAEEACASFSGHMKIEKVIRRLRKKEFEINYGINRKNKISSLVISGKFP